MTLTTQEYQLSVSGSTVYAKQWQPDELSSVVPIVMLHDSLGCVDLWRDYPALLAQAFGRSVIAYDRLGFGRSDLRVGLPSIDFIKEEAEYYFPQIKKQLGLDNYLLLGHSVGGGMAINIAARDADCLGVITLAAQAFVEKETLAGIEKAKALFQQPEQVKRLAKWHKVNAKVGGQSDVKALWVLNAWIEVWLSKAFLTWSLADCIDKVLCPVLALHGEHDEYGTQAFPQFIAERVSGASKYLILEDCGHIPHREKTAEVNHAISTFIKQYNL
jgi:pimeloyl-ACP methyl ester carboxylesterase